MNLLDLITKWHNENCFKVKNKGFERFDLGNRSDISKDTKESKDCVILSDEVVSEIRRQAEEMANSDEAKFWGRSANDYFAMLVDFHQRNLKNDLKYDYGIEIETLDNPGWRVRIYMRGLKENKRPFYAVEREISPEDWIHCKIEKGVFKGYGDTEKLEEVFRIFFEWQGISGNDKTIEGAGLLRWLMDWYCGNCDGEWEHCAGISIRTLKNPGWLVNIDLVDTEQENKQFDSIFFNNGESDWMYCTVEQKIFKGRGDPDKLIKILEIFKNWVVE